MQSGLQVWRAVRGAATWAPLPASRLGGQPRPAPHARHHCFQSPSLAVPERLSLGPVSGAARGIVRGDPPVAGTEPDRTVQAPRRLLRLPVSAGGSSPGLGPLEQS